MTWKNCLRRKVQMRNNLIYSFLFLFLTLIIFQSCQDEDSITYKLYFVNGKGLYEKKCQSCHGADGKGLGTLYPPLTDTTFLSSNKNKLACIIKKGMSGSISINNIAYDGKMPENENLANIDVAQVITYISNSFGNTQGLYDIESVEKALKACP